MEEIQNSAKEVTANATARAQLIQQSLKQIIRLVRLRIPIPWIQKKVRLQFMYTSVVTSKSSHQWCEHLNLYVCTTLPLPSHHPTLPSCTHTLLFRLIHIVGVVYWMVRIRQLTIQINKYHAMYIVMYLDITSPIYTSWFLKNNISINLSSCMYLILIVSTPK